MLILFRGTLYTSNALKFNQAKYVRARIDPAGRMQMQLKTTFSERKAWEQKIWTDFSYKATALKGMVLDKIGYDERLFVHTVHIVFYY
jgi:hypothetical protein